MLRVLHLIDSHSMPLKDGKPRYKRQLIAGHTLRSSVQVYDWLES